MKKFILMVMLTLLISGCQPKVPVEEPVDDPVVDPVIEEPVEEPIEEPEENFEFRSVFNGSPLKEETMYQAIAVMIENTSSARPHSGLGLADIVYEIAVDGWKVSRFLAIFQSEFPTKVGPVRSARMPFVKLQLEWILPFTHYGAAETGLGNAYAIIRKTKWPVRFDGVSGLNDEFFSRDKSRKSPHNAFFDAKSALTKVPSLNFEKRFLFDDTPSEGQLNVTTLNIEYSTINKIRYSYDESVNKYFRFINEEPMMDVYTDTQIAVTNIILLHAPHRTVEHYDYVLVDFISTGKAEYFINGKYIEGTWIKENEKAITTYFDLAGNEIVLMPGNTWIQVIASRYKISYE